MTRSLSDEHPKPSKRKGTRSVSTLTPSQLARKRANDREAQRAIRARTKEHIERLERELDEYRSSQSRDKTVQDLLRRNRALEDELRRLKDNLGPSMTPTPYSGHAVYDDNLSVASIPSPQMSPLPSGTDYGPLPDYGHQQQPQAYVSLPKSCDSWASGLTTGTIPSSVPSPCSSVNDEYGAGTGYIPTSMPTSLLSQTKDPKMEYDDMSSAAQAYMPQQEGQHQHQPPQSQQQQQHAPSRHPNSSWSSLYQQPVEYYTPFATPACRSR
ncbi:hypothetical protein CDD80_4182 [Ophiocordyceps camponoti-rufipedis]|uniref:BZIP domain-containing protein n=1 Tax=Ophiocordyceps camponoti-rufipedis TaxID=2004952 RepID=A0A2C5YYR3_9HYPO|nr:hypothetical protein CDD80_4182 [Ophiocordyceps camponoti-rufipedis]